MHEYIIVLGREPELSVAELAAVSRRLGRPLEFRAIQRSLVMVRGELNEQVNNALAGTVKIAEVLNYAPASQAGLVSLLLSFFSPAKRCEFGLSWYGDRPPRWLLAAGLELKKKLKENNHHVRLVTSRASVLSSVVVRKNKLLPPHGFEFLLIEQEGKILVARTIWVQDFEAWGERDYGRPRRDAKVGMLPPKLARLMLNLAEAKPGAGILDPFCGSGTVLQEAAILGYRHLVGVDADAEGIARTQANFGWLRQHLPHLPEPALLVSEISKLPEVLSGSKFEAIVTEPYLGPALRGHESVQQLRQIHDEISEFYRRALKVMKHVLKDDGRLVMVWPVWRSRHQNLSLGLLDELRDIGFVQIDLLPKAVPMSWRNSRGTLWYARPEARVIREIVALEKIRLG